MTKYAEFEQISSIFNLSPNNDPFEEAEKLMLRATNHADMVRIEKALLEKFKEIIIRNDEDFLRQLDSVADYAIDKDYFIQLKSYQGGLRGDSKRISADFSKAAKKLYEETGYCDMHVFGLHVRDIQSPKFKKKDQCLAHDEPTKCKWTKS